MKSFAPPISALISTLVLLCVGGCNNSSAGYTPKPRQAVEPIKVDPTDKTSLMPLREGSQWIYTIEVRGTKLSGTGEVIYKVVKSTEVNGKITAKLELSQGGVVIDRQEWIVDSEGIYQATVLYQADGKSKEVPFEPSAQPIAKNPPVEGQKFTWKGTGITPAGSMGKIEFESSTETNREVDTEIDRFSAVSVRTLTKFTTYAKPKFPQESGSADSTAWFTPGVGLVRYVQQTRIGSQTALVTLKLKSFSLK